MFDLIGICQDRRESICRYVNVTFGYCVDIVHVLFASGSCAVMRSRCPSWRWVDRQRFGRDHRMVWRNPCRDGCCRDDHDELLVVMQVDDVDDNCRQ